MLKRAVTKSCTQQQARIPRAAACRGYRVLVVKLTAKHQCKLCLKPGVSSTFSALAVFTKMADTQRRLSFADTSLHSPEFFDVQQLLEATRQPSLDRLQR